MKNTGLFCLLLAVSVCVSAQSQLENPGFEDWENLGTPQAEPVNWSSIKTSPVDLYNNSAPVVCWQSEDAHSGSHSVKLQNIEVQLVDLVATGTLTNGRVHSDFSPDLQYIYTDTEDDRWHATFTAKPDSLAGWYKYYPVDNDTALVRVLLHTGEARIPDTGTPDNWVAEAFFQSPSDTVDQWTRFSVPFHYYNDDNPEYALAILNSGNGFNSQPNSIVFFDDIEMIYNVPVGLQENKGTSFTVFIDSNGFLMFSGMENSTNTIRIIDATGRVLLMESLTGDETGISVKALHPGLYFVSVENSRERSVQKIIVE